MRNMRTPARLFEVVKSLGILYTTPRFPQPHLSMFKLIVGIKSLHATYEVGTMCEAPNFYSARIPLILSGGCFEGNRYIIQHRRQMTILYG